jgi:hypothetical protein
MGQYQSYSPALFPTSIFPALSTASYQGNASTPPPQPAKQGRESEELLEGVAILALLRLLS